MQPSTLAAIYFPLVDWIVGWPLSRAILAAFRDLFFFFFYSTIVRTSSREEVVDWIVSTLEWKKACQALFSQWISFANSASRWVCIVKKPQQISIFASFICVSLFIALNVQTFTQQHDCNCAHIHLKIIYQTALEIVLTLSLSFSHKEVANFESWKQPLQASLKYAKEDTEEEQPENEEPSEVLNRGFI